MRLLAVEILLPLPVLVPVFLLLHGAVFRRWDKTAGYFLFAWVLAGIWTVTGLPDVTYGRFEPHLNLIPLCGMFASAYTVRNTLLNVLLFVPVGALLPLLWKRYRDGRLAVLFGFLLSLFVELMQLFSRATDIDDLITNTLGTWLGYLVGCVLLLWFPKLGREDGTLGERGLVLGTVFFAMFFVCPFVSDFVWGFLVY